MGAIKSIVVGYSPYTVFDGKELYSIGVVSKIIKKSSQTIILWDKWSEELLEIGEERLIPEPYRVGSNKVRCWEEWQIFLILKFSRSIKYGDLAKFSRGQWGKRSETLKQDKSKDAREEKKKERHTINKNAKKIQNRKKIEEIKNARKDMLRCVRKRSKNLYDDMKIDENYTED